MLGAMRQPCGFLMALEPSGRAGCQFGSRCLFARSVAPIQRAIHQVGDGSWFWGAEV